MQEIGTVKSLDGINARVLISRQSGPCDHCTEEACTVPEEGIETYAINTAGAKVGQKVKIVMKSFTYAKGAIVIYIMPVVALIAGAILGQIVLPQYFAKTSSDILAAGSGLTAFFASLFLVKIMLNRMDKKTESKPVIESIVEN